MNPLNRLSEYLGVIERRLRWLTLSRGAAATAGAALGAASAGTTRPARTSPASGSTRTIWRTRLMSDLRPCECGECDCDQYAEPDGDLCYDCEAGIHREDR